MCTTGAIVLSKDEYILFKNKDFGKKQFQDHLVLEEDLFGASGTETFAEQDVAKEVFSGLSIGANSHGLFGCDSHVSYEPVKAANYDKLVEVALRDAEDVDSAVSVLKEHVRENPTWAGNLVLTDGSKTARIEARGTELQVQIDLHSIVSTNHQFLFSSDNAEASASSSERLNSADKRLSKATSIDEVFALLASHDRGDTGVCNHQAELKTVYSYVLHSKNGIATLYVSNQQPCETDKYHALELPIGSNWNQTNVAEFQESYPN